MKKIIIGLFVVFALMATVFAEDWNMSCFEDVGNDHPYLWSIIDLTREGIIVGYGDGTFRPDQEVTRAEFLKMTFLYLGSYGENIYSGLTGCFDDTEGHWAEEIICFGHSNQIVEGDGTDGLFHPDRLVNFVEAAKIMTYVNGNTFEDSDVWYEGPVAFLETTKLIPHTILSLSHQLTRGEVAEILYRMKKGVQSTDLYVDGMLEGDREIWEYINPEYIRKDGLLYDSDGMYLDLEWLTDEIAVDSVNVYYVSDLGFAGIIPGISTLELIVPDSHRLFYETLDDYSYYDPVPVIFVDHVMAGGNSYLLVNSDWFDGKGNLWREALYMTDGDEKFEMIGDSFAVLTIPNEEGEEVEFYGKHHFRVGGRVFYLNDEIEGADSDSFEPYLDGDDMAFMQTYSHDKDNVYIRAEVVEEADPETFRSTDTSWYYVDDLYLFNSGGENLGSKEGIELYVDSINYYAKTDEGVFLFGHTVPGADPESFEFDSITYCGWDSERFFLTDQKNGLETVYREATKEEWDAVCTYEE